MFRFKIWRCFTRFRTLNHRLFLLTLHEVETLIPKSTDVRYSFTTAPHRPYFTAPLSKSSIDARNSMPEISSKGLDIIQEIENSVKYLNRVTAPLLDDLLYVIEVEGYSPDDKTWALLLRCCGHLMPEELPQARITLANKLWDLLKHSGHTPTLEHYNALLHSYLENRNSVSLSQLLQLLENTKPNKTTYILLLELMCEDGNVTAVTEVLASMKKENIPASEQVFNALLKCNAKLRDIESCKKIFETMQAAKIPLTADTFSSLLEGFVEAGDLRNVNKFYIDAMNSSIIFSEKHILNILRKATLSTDSIIIDVVLQLFPSGSINKTPNIVNFIIHLVHLGKMKESYNILKSVAHQTTGIIEEAQNFADFFIEEIVKTNQQPSMVVNVCKDLEDTGRNTRALLKAAKDALSFKKMEIALSLFQTMKSRDLPLRPHYFWPLLVTEAEENGEKGVFNILCHMQELDVKPDSDTLKDYVLPHCSLSDPFLLVRKLQDMRFKLFEIMNSVLAVLLRQGSLDQVKKLCETLKFQINASSLTNPLAVAYLITNDLKTAIHLIKTFSHISTRKTDVAGNFLLEILKSKRIKAQMGQIVEVIKAFTEDNIQISMVACDAICNQLQHHIKDLQELKINKDQIYNLANSETAMDQSKQVNNQILHPQEMNIEELECHLLELQSKDMNTRGVLRKLLQMYSGQGDTENAVRIQKEFEAAGFDFSPGMYSALFEAHIKANELENAKKYFMLLLKEYPSFKIDEYKIIDYTTLLVHSGQEEDGLNVLQMFASAHEIKYPSGFSRNCWKLLNAMAEKKDPKSTKRLFQKMVDLGYCSATNVLLGPVIRTFLNCNDLEGAVFEYVNCAKELHKTPLQHELLCCLVGHEQHQHLLRQVIDATVIVHGTDAASVAHAAAVAEAGSVAQLQAILKRKRFNWPVFIERCKRFADEKKLSVLEKIASACKGWSCSYTPIIYTCMLDVYCRQGDCEGALGLWTSAQENNVIPESEFLIKLASLLKTHKHQVPFEVPATYP